MLTNFATVRKSIKKMSNIDKMAKDGTFEILSKKEKLMITRDRIKLERVLGGIADLNRLPAALFIIDVKKEHIAVTEALKLNIPTFAMVDTNSDPTDIDFAIPANDDATKSISLIAGIITKAIEEGLEERKREREEDAEKEGAAAKIAAETAETTEKSADKATDKSAPRKRKSESTEKSAE
jgi:small subunit ribosomal protein S2